MIILSYLAACLIGVSLGLIGGGGSILTVPVLVYLFKVQPVLATSYSLFIVGTTALVGALPKHRQGLVNMKAVLIFGVPSIIAVFATRSFLVPLIPGHVATIGTLVITKNILLMLLFALLMVAASLSMILKNKVVNEKDLSKELHFNYPLILLEGLVVGVLTGLVGAGGGFLIIPALVMLSKLPMKQAIGTSLLIIAAKSLIGFCGDLSHYTIDWFLLISVTSVSVAGIFIGDRMSKKIHGNKLKQGFGWFVLVMGIYIIVKEIYFPSAH